MASENAKAVAMEVLEKVSNGKFVSKKEIIRNHGYAESIAKIPQKVTDTKSYQSVVSPFIQKLEKERDRLILEAQSRNLTEEDYKTLIEGIDKFTKNIELLSGRATERTEKPLTEDQLNELFNRRSKETLPTG